MMRRHNPCLLAALALTLVYHGGLLFFTFKRTYDAYVHIFFADHYRRAWFDHWEYRWYTGFTLTSYPPGSHQTIAILSKILGLPNSYIAVQTLALILCALGIYRFARLWVSEEAAGYAALLLVFSSSIAETTHVFGQLPTTFSLGFLLNALPYMYRWLKRGKWSYLGITWSAYAATTAGHHVTTLFGSVFFAAPVIILAFQEKFSTPLPDEPFYRASKVTLKNLRPLMIRQLRRVLPVTGRTVLFGIGLVFILIIVIFPYWVWSRTDPIVQVPIPHASRDSYIENPAAGLIFWLVPYGVALVALPYVFFSGFFSRAWPITLSFTLLFVLGTGGTTPIPRLLLQGAYDILTLDRFTFWANIIMLPLVGEFVVSLRWGGLSWYLRDQFGDFAWRAIQSLLLIAYLLFSIWTANLTQFRRFQPDPIDMQPIVNFIAKDEHWRWRYLTLGFGDQMAWLSTQTTATTVDGNYHSARRIPELTSTPVERLEGAKFRGIPGIGSLQQFLTVPDKYNLRYIFSNDEFYDPLLYFTGWHQVGRLENGIMVWEREDVARLPEILPRKEIPLYQRLMWGVIPPFALLLAAFTMTSAFWKPYLRRVTEFLEVEIQLPGLLPPGRRRLTRGWQRIDRRLRQWSHLPVHDNSPVLPWQPWIQWIHRLAHAQPVPPTRKQIRTFLLFTNICLTLTLGVVWYLQQARTPTEVIEAYYDHLDFRRFEKAYQYLDPETRPSFDLYLLQLSVTGGLVASFGDLDSITTRVIRAEPKRVELEVETRWLTSLLEYVSYHRHTLVLRNKRWYIVPKVNDVSIPPDQFFRRGVVAWHSQGRRRVTTETTPFADIIDRPEIEILSAALVRRQSNRCISQIDPTSQSPTTPPSCYRYSVVGEIINTDVDPADLSVTAVLFDENQTPLTWYNAQSAMIHKLLPKEVTPFRVDFEGVAGAVLSDLETAGDFQPDAFSPIMLSSPIASFDVRARAVVATRDLYRDVAAQDLQLQIGDDGRVHLSGRLLNNGTWEATVPHLLITYYDENQRVIWVDHAFLEQNIRPQRTLAFDITLTSMEEIEVLMQDGRLIANSLPQTQSRQDPTWRERIPAPPGVGYTHVRVSVNYFVRSNQ